MKLYRFLFAFVAVICLAVNINAAETVSTGIYTTKASDWQCANLLVTNYGNVVISDFQSNATAQQVISQFLDGKAYDGTDINYQTATHYNGTGTAPQEPAPYGRGGYYAFTKAFDLVPVSDANFNLAAIALNLNFGVDDQLVAVVLNGHTFDLNTGLAAQPQNSLFSLDHTQTIFNDKSWIQSGANEITFLTYNWGTSSSKSGNPTSIFGASNGNAGIISALFSSAQILIDGENMGCNYIVGDNVNNANVKGEVDYKAELTNKGIITSLTADDGSIKNYGTIVDLNAFNTYVTNQGTINNVTLRGNSVLYSDTTIESAILDGNGGFEGNGKINKLVITNNVMLPETNIYDGEVINNGVLGSLSQYGGELFNGNEIGTATQSGGKLTNEGYVGTTNHFGGELINSGNITSLHIENHSTPLIEGPNASNGFAIDGDSINVSVVNLANGTIGSVTVEAGSMWNQGYIGTAHVNDDRLLYNSGRIHTANVNDTGQLVNSLDGRVDFLKITIADWHLPDINLPDIHLPDIHTPVFDIISDFISSLDVPTLPHFVVDVDEFVRRIRVGGEVVVESKGTTFTVEPERGALYIGKGYTHELDVKNGGKAENENNVGSLMLWGNAAPLWKDYADAYGMENTKFGEYATVIDQIYDRIDQIAHFEDSAPSHTPDVVNRGGIAEAWVHDGYLRNGDQENVGSIDSITLDGGYLFNDQNGVIGELTLNGGTVFGLGKIEDIDVGVNVLLNLATGGKFSEINGHVQDIINIFADADSVGDVADGFVDKAVDELLLSKINKLVELRDLVGQTATLGAHYAEVAGGLMGNLSFAHDGGFLLIDGSTGGDFSTGPGSVLNSADIDPLARSTRTFAAMAAAETVETEAKKYEGVRFYGTVDLTGVNLVIDFSDVDLTKDFIFDPSKFFHFVAEKEGGEITGGFKNSDQWWEGLVSMSVYDGEQFRSLYDWTNLTTNGYVQWADFFEPESSAPEPATMLIIGLGLAGLGLARRRMGK